MARPKKEKELQHKHQIMLRLTDTEYEIVSESAKAANLPLADKALGFYVGSGAIESGNKVVLQKRLKLAGMK